MDRTQETARRLAGDVLATPVVAVLTDLLRSAGYEVLLVGGSVRDALDGVPAAGRGDVDVATDATPDQVHAVLEDTLFVVPTGEQHGTVTARHPDGVDGVEVSTFRHDTYDLDSRRPRVTFSTSYEDDARRRDFTVNAIGVRLPGGELVDPTGGVEDLASGTLRAPRDAHTMFREDPLRILRMVRFAAVRGWRPDPATSAAAQDHAETVDDQARCPVERRTVELYKVLAGPPGALSAAYAHARRVGVLTSWVGAPLAAVDPATFDHADLDASQRLAAMAWQLPHDQRAGALAARMIPKTHARRAAGAAAVLDEPTALSARRAGKAATAAAAAVAAAYRHRDAQWLADVARTYEQTVGVAMPVTGDDLIAEFATSPGLHIGFALSVLEAWLLEDPVRRRDDRAGALQRAGQALEVYQQSRSTWFHRRP